MHNYGTIVTFRSSGYLPDGRYSYRESKSWPLKASRLSYSDSYLPMPVHGVPMRARDTLLAQLMASSAGMALLNRGAIDYRMVDQGLRGLRKQLQTPNSTLCPSLKDRARRIESLVGKLIGVEVEFYPRSVSSLPTTLSGGLGDVAYDGSIGNGGREIRRMTWASTGRRLPAVLQLAPLLEGGHVDRKCGLHVHIDARHLPKPGKGTPELCDAAETYDRLVMLYPMLKKLVPPSRLRNSYCKWAPNRDGHPSARTISSRYAAINWHAYTEHGSIEFRMASGSTNIVKIESWALLCQHLVYHCSRREWSVPSTWKQFLAILPKWMASWCAIRQLKLSSNIDITDRTASAADFSTSTSTSVE